MLLTHEFLESCVGLVNGTLGVVHDIIVDHQSGLPVAVLVKVRKASLDSDGYHGDSFLTDGIDTRTEAVVPVPMIRKTVRTESADKSSSGQKEVHARTQFPLALAWALTVHKAQGLTLPRVLYDPNEDERPGVGLTFVAMTRVRHPHHLVMRTPDGAFPDLERLTLLIRCKPDLLSDNCTIGICGDDA